MKALKNPQVIELDRLGVTHKLASYSFGYNHFSPAIGRNSGGKGWYVRILAGQSWRGSTVNTSWDYFKTDDSGLIVESPRGMASQYNGRVRITVESLEAATDKYKELQVNQ
jgi:hypothetical protein